MLVVKGKEENKQRNIKASWYAMHKIMVLNNKEKLWRHVEVSKKSMHKKYVSLLILSIKHQNYIYVKVNQTKEKLVIR